jgi:ComF family protein
MQVNNWLNFVQSTLFPAHCALCGSPLDHDSVFCPDCYRDLPYNKTACPQCAVPLAHAVDTACGRCTRQPPPFTSSHVPLRYEPPFSRLIGEFKFHHRLHLTASLSALFCATLPEWMPRPDLLLPVPLHPSRLRERGFNQSLELARRIAGELELELDWHCLRRVRATPSQSRLDRHARGRNLHSAFAADGVVKGLHIALLDDVITTGATVTAASRVLLRAGARRVDVWALARTPSP